MLDFWQARRAHQRVLLAFFVLFSSPGLSLGQEGDPERLLREADRLLQSGDSDGALQLFHRFKQSWPEDARGYYGLGRLLTSADRLAEASVELLSAVELAPHQDDYRLAAAAVLTRLGDLGRATAVLSPFDGKALETTHNQNALWLLADLYYRREILDKAQHVLDRLSALDSDPSAISQMQGEIHLIEGRFPAAESEFRAVIEGRPDSAAAHYGLGMSQWRQLETGEAAAALEKAVELAPDNPGYRLDLGRLRIEMEDFEAAVEILEATEQATPASPEVLYELSRAHRRLGNSEKADGYLQRFNNLRREKEEARVNRRRAEQVLQEGKSLLTQGRIAEARRQFMEAVRIDPASWTAHSFLAKIYLSSGMLADAGRHLFKMRDLDADSAEGNYLLASYYYQGRQLEEALQAGLLARSQRPDYSELRNLLGNILFALNRIDEAIAEYKEAVSLAPDRGDFRRNLETALKKK